MSGSQARFRVLARNLALPVWLAAAVAGAWWLGVQAALYGPYGQPASNVFVGELVAGRCVGQTIVADAAGLYRIDVFLATYQRVNRGPIIFHVRAAPFAVQDWATLSVDASTVRDNAFQSFEFRPLPLPAGVPAYFCLEAPLGAAGNAITVGGRSDDAYPGGRAILATGAEAAPLADLAFRLYYRPGARYAAGEVLARLAGSKPGVFGQAWLYTGLIGAYVFIAFAFGLAISAGLRTRSGQAAGSAAAPGAEAGTRDRS